MHIARAFSIAALSLVVCSLALPAAALQLRTNPLAVVELFTSQGCPRCPDADAYLEQLGTRAEVVALAYHVDYWDYAGWEDTFALPANGELQRDYAVSRGKNRIYTPQMVINGEHGVVGTQVDEVESLLGVASLDVNIALEPRGTQAVDLHADGNPNGHPAVVWLVTFKSAADVIVERGENGGQTLHYSHIVTGRQAIGMWDPLSGADITVPLTEVLGRENDGAALLIQEKNNDLPGRIIGAALLAR